MKPQAWGLSIVASVALHGAGFAGLALTLKPDPIPDQPVPESSFSIEAAEVARSRAEPERAEGDLAPELAAPSADAQSGTIPQSTATAQIPESATVAAALPQSTPLQAEASSDAENLNAAPAPVETLVAQSGATVPLAAMRAPPSKAQAVVPSLNAAPVVAATAPVQAALAPAAASVQSQAPQGTPAKSVGANSAVAPAASPDGEQAEAVAVTGELAQTATPTGALTEATPAQGQTALAASAQGQPALPAALQSSRPANLPLPAIVGTATLAWVGGGETPISAASLAAIAAFTQEGDLNAASEQVRDGIEGILASVPCARLQTTFIPATGQLELRGHIPEDALRGPVLAALRAQVGDAIPLSDALLILPRPQCGALAGIADVGLPQSTEQLTNPAVIGEDGFAQNYTYLNGQRLHLDLTAPDYDGFVYVDYFTADGSVLHLQPNEIVPLEFSPAKSPLSVGRARSDGKPTLELTVSPPFGQEIAAAFATSAPLYEEVRPLQEPAAPYLAFLKEKVAQARADDPDFKGEWVYFFISTQAD